MKHGESSSLEGQRRQVHPLQSAHRSRKPSSRRTGVTRDWTSASRIRRGTRAELVDTGDRSGRRRAFRCRGSSGGTRQLSEADLLLFVVDGVSGRRGDFEVADILRRVDRSVILVVNSAIRRSRSGLNEFFDLGFGEPLASRPNMALVSKTATANSRGPPEGGGHRFSRRDSEGRSRRAAERREVLSRQRLLDRSE